ncbi:hypothetical protein ACFLTH_09935, partial [Bacteroidota bacterium]
NSYVSGIVKSVEIVNKFEHVQSFDENIFREELNEFAVYKGLENDKEFLDINKEIQEKVTINSKILSARVEYFENGNTREHTIITKTVTASELLSDVSIVENIPKLVADDANDILFSKNPVVIKKDPVVEWEFSELTSQSFYYVIEGLVDISKAKETKTSVFKKISSIVDSEQTNDENEITGLVLGNADGSKFSWIFIVLGMITIAGLLVYYFFFLKEETSEEVEAPRIVNKKLPRPSVSSVAGVSHSGSLTELISAADKKADELEFNTVYKLYMSILHLFSATDFHNNNERVQMSSEIARIYSKLLLFSKIGQANKLLSMEDLNGLRKALDDIGKILRLHENDNSYFYSYANILYKHYLISTMSLGGQNNA